MSNHTWDSRYFPGCDDEELTDLACHCIQQRAWRDLEEVASELRQRQHRAEVEKLTSDARDAIEHEDWQVLEKVASELRERHGLMPMA